METPKVLYSDTECWEYRCNTVKFSPIDCSLLAVPTGREPIRGGHLAMYDTMLDHTFGFNTPFHNMYDCTWSLTNPNLIIIATNAGGSYLMDISLCKNQRLQSFVRSNPTVTTSVDWHPEGGSFISASTDGIVNLWSIGQRKPQYTYNHRSHVSSVTWNPRDPTLYASTCFDGILYIRDIRSENAGITIQADDANLTSCDWNWHGNTCIATASANRSCIKVWDLTQPNIPIRVFDEAHTAGVRKVKFSPHWHHQIASASDDNSVVLWDYGHNAKGPEITRYEHHTASVIGLDMSKQARDLLASCGEGGFIHVWWHAQPKDGVLEF
ncbi:peroxisome biogenesis protein 7-like [Magnolia sinica]|uniref:peroxisome biogenesis protein 7-like n=1 Tax=Magnolia sinica TaxID=86752 RepID=UPI00265B0880|nr:peroxisome biogenesis protein 7-like [Magnolia sinica]